MGKAKDIAKKALGGLDLIQTRETKNKKLSEEVKDTNRLLSKTRIRGESAAILAARKQVLEEAKRKFPKTMEWPSDEEPGGGESGVAPS